MPLDREHVEGALEVFNADGATSERLAKKLTAKTNGTVVTGLEVSQFLQSAVNDDPPWVTLADGRWRLLKLQSPALATATDGDDVHGGAVKSDLMPAEKLQVANSEQDEPSDEDGSVPELIERITRMRKDRDYPSWYIRPREDLGTLGPKALQGILRRGNNALHLITELRNHPEHDIFSRAHDELTKKEIAIDGLEQGNEQLRLQIEELTRQRDARYSQEDVGLLSDRIEELEKLPVQSQRPVETVTEEVVVLDGRLTSDTSRERIHRRVWKRVRPIVTLRNLLWIAVVLMSGTLLALIVTVWVERNSQVTPPSQQQVSVPQVQGSHVEDLQPSIERAHASRKRAREILKKIKD